MKRAQLLKAARSALARDAHAAVLHRADGAGGWHAARRVAVTGRAPAALLAADAGAAAVHARAPIVAPRHIASIAQGAWSGGAPRLGHAWIRAERRG